MSSNPRSGRRSTASKSKAPVKYVRFSDKLTDSMDDISAMIREHQSMIDSIQEIALELTEAIGSMHTLALKYAGKINKLLDNLLPIVKNLPIIPKKVTKLLVDMEKMTQKIIDNKVRTHKTISDVKSGLKTGNMKKIQGQTDELKKVTRTITSLIPSGK